MLLMIDVTKCPQAIILTLEGNFDHMKSYGNLVMLNMKYVSSYALYCLHKV